MNPSNEGAHIFGNIMKAKTKSSSSKRPVCATDDQSGAAPISKLPNAPQTGEPAFRGEVGPDGDPVVCNGFGGMVEWRFSNEEEREEFGQFSPIIRRRDDAALRREYVNLREKYWWNSYQNSAPQLAECKEQLRSGQTPNRAGVFFLEQVEQILQEKAEGIERKFGKENLTWNDFENGRLTALNWAMGADWDAPIIFDPFSVVHTPSRLPRS